MGWEPRYSIEAGMAGVIGRFTHVDTLRMSALTIENDR